MTENYSTTRNGDIKDGGIIKARKEDNRLPGPSPPKIGTKLTSMGRLKGTLVWPDAAES